MLTDYQKVVKITGAGTIHAVAATCYLRGLVASIVSPGTLFISIQNVTAPENILVPPLVPTVPGTPINWEPPIPVRMNGGMDIVTVGAGEAYYWLWYGAQPT